MAMLPGRCWQAIRNIGTQRLSLPRGRVGGKDRTRYTPEEDELVRRYDAGDIIPSEVLAIGRSSDSIKERAKNLGLKWVPRQPS